MNTNVKGRSLSVLAIFVLTILGFIVGAQTWVTYSLAPGEAAVNVLSVSGNSGLAPLMPILVALGAIAITLMIVARVVRVMLGVLVTLLGAWLTVSSFKLVAADTNELLWFGRQYLAEVTGVVVSEQNLSITEVSSTFWPVILGVIGVLVLVVGLFVTLTGYKWVTGGRKYETIKKTNNKSQGDNRIDDWDALSGGEDPSQIE
ncbi:MAG TPA: Trp biosynthesis-associated membrane protein [Microbacteriaceae bacterium]|nr:Trp biosynthesis-associated membrane protein [Microbacteriaceae bacterium]